MEKNPIAKELLFEINAYLKEAKMNKKSYMFDQTGDDFMLKPWFGYWVAPILEELKKQGSTELSTVTIPSLSKGADQKACMDFGNNLMSKMQSSGGGTPTRRMSPRERSRLQQPTTDPLGIILKKIWGELKSETKKNWTKTYNKYNGEMPFDVEEGKMNAWAFSSLGHDQKGQKQRSSVIKQLKDATKNTDNLVKDVKDALKKGLWSKSQQVTSWQGSYSETGISIQDLSRNQEPFANDEFGDIDSRIDQDTSIPPVSEEEVENALSITNVLGEEDEEEAVDNFTSMIEDTHDQGSDPQIPEGAPNELEEAIQELKLLKSNTQALLIFKKILEQEDTHWLLDSDKYIPEWGVYTSKFDADAMFKLDSLIKQSGDKSIPYALRYFVDMDRNQLENFVHFVDNCIELETARSLGKGNPCFAWFLFTALRVEKGNLEVRNQASALIHGRKNGTVFIKKPKHTEHTLMSWWSMFARGIKNMTPNEANDFKTKIKAITQKVRPSFITDAKVDQYLDTLIKKVDNNEGSKLLTQLKNFIGTTKIAPQVGGVFFSTIASEMIRYRYYMDLNMEDHASDPLVPNTLGKTDCDNAVKAFIPVMPSAILSKIQGQVIEESYLSSWGEVMEGIVEKRLKINIGSQTKLSDSITKLYEKLEVEGLDTVRTKRNPSEYNQYGFDEES